MSAEFIDTAVVTTPVKITTIDSVSVVDIHPLSSEWKHYLVMFTPSQPGPVVSAYIRHLSLSLTYTYNRDPFFTFMTAPKVKCLSLAARLTWRDLLPLKCKYISFIIVLLTDLVITLSQRWSCVLYVPPGWERQRRGFMWSRCCQRTFCDERVMSHTSGNALKLTLTRIPLQRIPNGSICMHRQHKLLLDFC